MKKIPSIESLLRDYDNFLPRKIIDDKQVFDFDKSPTALFVACFITHQDKVLLLKRSQEVTTNKGKWNVIAGYYDEPLPTEEKVLEELNEEANIKSKDILNMKVLPTLQMTVPSGQLWYVVPVQIELSKQIEPVLNWENTEYLWVTKEEASKLDLVSEVLPMINQILKK